MTVSANSGKKQPNLVVLGILIEGLLVALAIGFSMLGFFDQSQPLDEIDRGTLTRGAVWGVAGLIPMLAYLAWFHFYPTRLLQPMRDFVDAEMRPMFRNCTLLDLAVISILAGFCEELFFRWCIQGGLVQVMPEGPVFVCTALLIASVIFGLCHWLNASYGLSTTVIGVYLGAMMIFSGSWLGPAIAHTLFDFIALLYIARWQPEGSSMPDSKDADDQDADDVAEHQKGAGDAGDEDADTGSAAVQPIIDPFEKS